jgi:hypothetical protein
MSFWWNAGFEAAKLSLQFGGALFIAWRTVKWALKRYKDEKHWERKLGAYSDLTSALGTLLNVLAEWEDQDITDSGPVGITVEEQRQIYWAARRQLEDAQSTAMLLLPPHVAELIKTLVMDLAREDARDHEAFIYKIDGLWKLVQAARDAIVSLGRKDLQIG